MDPNKAIVDQIIASRGLDAEAEEAVREAVRQIVSRYPTMAIDRGAMLTIPYEPRAEPTLAPVSDVDASEPATTTTGPTASSGPCRAGARAVQRRGALQRRAATVPRAATPALPSQAHFPRDRPRRRRLSPPWSA